MKNRIPLAATCLRLLALISFASVVITVTEATTAVGGLSGGVLVLLDMLLVPVVIGLGFGIGFLSCARHVKQGSARAWTCAFVLLILSLLKSVGSVLLIGFLFDFHWRGLAFGAAQFLLPGIGLWALLQPGSRAFITAQSSSR